MVEKVVNFIAVTHEELLRQVQVAQECREFWYKAYVRASTYAIEQIDGMIAEAKATIRVNHEGCENALDDMEQKINALIRQMFITDGRKTGSNAILPSSVPVDGDRS